jgi:hypothetical protein
MQYEGDTSEILGGLKGQAPWAVKLGIGSFLTMEFGKPEQTESSPYIHGEWHLWLYMCNWRIESGNIISTGSNDDRLTIDTTLKETLLGSVENITLLHPALDLSIQFSSGTKLHTFSSSSDREEGQWKLFTPDDHCLTIYGDGSYEYPLSHQPHRAK